MHFRHEFISSQSELIDYIIHFIIQNKTSPNIGILLKGVLIPRLLNNPFASCFLINSNFLLPRGNIAHFDIIIVLPLLVEETFGSILSVFFCSLNNKTTLLYI